MWNSEFSSRTCSTTISKGNQPIEEVYPYTCKEKVKDCRCFFSGLICSWKGPMKSKRYCTLGKTTLGKLSSADRAHGFASVSESFIFGECWYRRAPNCREYQSLELQMNSIVLTVVVEWRILETVLTSILLQVMIQWIWFCSLNSYDVLRGMPLPDRERVS